jgi:hypothetical protein
VHAVAGEHAAHAAGALAYVPTGQVDAVYAQEVALAGLKEPAAQGVHTAEDCAPTEVEYEPAAQAVQPVADKNVPAGHKKVMVTVKSEKAIPSQ